MSGKGEAPIIYDFNAKSLKDTITTRNDQAGANKFKAVPAEIVGVSDYESLQCVDVKFLINDVYVERDNLKLESITLKKVFVALPNAGGFSLKFPVSIGDIVTLYWSHRDLGEFLDGDGSAVDLNITEIAHIEDCWVQLNFGTRKNHTNPSKDNLVIEGPNTVITITPEGAVKLTTDTVELDSDVTIKNLTVTGTTDLVGTTTIEGKPFLSHTHSSDGNGPPN